MAFSGKGFDGKGFCCFYDKCNNKAYYQLSEDQEVMIETFSNEIINQSRSDKEIYQELCGFLKRKPNADSEPGILKTCITTPNFHCVNKDWAPQYIMHIQRFLEDVEKNANANALAARNNAPSGTSLAISSNQHELEAAMQKLCALEKAKTARQLKETLEKIAKLEAKEAASQHDLDAAMQKLYVLAKAKAARELKETLKKIAKLEAEEAASQNNEN